ncbi:MAG: hypothetical protein ACOX8S_09420 [Christensenellales bacterium]|jgi:putative aldouronate transport system substrate-binding protein
MKAKKLMALLIVAAMMFAVLGCSNGGQSSSGSGQQAAQSTGQTAQTGNAEFSYPLEGNPKLSYFGQFHQKLAGFYESYDDLPIVQLWKEAVGVEFDWNTPAAGIEKEQFNMMLASGEYTDIINYSLMNYSGGLMALYNDGVLAKLTDHVYDWAPNIMAYYEKHPEMMKEAKDDNGDYYVFPIIKDGVIQLSTQGPLLRGDILAELGYETPETIDEWDTVLRAVKAAYPQMSPFIGSWGNICESFQPAYGVSKGAWFGDTEDVVYYAYIQEGYKEFLMQMAQWYADGLIDSNMPTMDTTTMNNAMSAGTAFSNFASGGNGIGAYMDANKDNPTFTVVGAMYPSLEKGILPLYTGGYPFDRQVGISQSCDQLEIAMRVLDYGYSEEGATLLNWGVEGESYYVGDDGEKHFFDHALYDPEGLLTVDAQMAKCSVRHIKGPPPYLSLEAVFLANYEKPEQKAACDLWSTQNWEHRSFPRVSYSVEESTEFASIMADINTYADSMSMKFVLGTESFDNWDNYVQTIKSWNIERATQIQQAALDRYNAR